MLSNLTFFIAEAFTSLKRNALMTMVAIGTITVSLCIFGFFLLFVVNMGNIVGTLGSKVDLVAYAKHPLKLEQGEDLKIKIGRIDGVRGVEWISREKAWQNFQEEFSSRFNLSEIVEDNPLPDTFLVRVRTPDMVTQTAKNISSLSEVEEVSFNPDLVSKLGVLIDAFRIGGLVIVTLLSLATLFIVVNTIRLTVLARETEITIMRLVGATRSFIRWPFIIEGVLLGLVGGGLAIFILRVTYESVIVRIQEALPFVPLLGGGFLIVFIYSTVVLVGIFLGMLGGYISVNRQLKEA